MHTKNRSLLHIILPAIVIGAFFAPAALISPAARIAFVAHAQSPRLTSSATASGISTNAIAPKSNGAVDATTANEFAALLSSISTISIDTSIFGNPAYKALRDYPIVLGNDIVGRNDPFAPIGSDNGAVAVADSPASGDAAAGATTTPSLPPFSIKTGTVTKITSTTAQFAASVVMPSSVPVAVVFQYGTSDTLGSVTAPIQIKNTSNPYGTIKGLLPETTYYVKAVGVYGNQDPVSGNMVSFTTQAQQGISTKKAGKQPSASAVSSAKKTKSAKKSKAR